MTDPSVSGSTARGSLLVLLGGAPVAWPAFATAIERVVASAVPGTGTTGVVVRVHRRVAHDPMDAVQASPPPWQAAVEVEAGTGADAFLSAAARVLGPVLTSHLDPAPSAVVAGARFDLHAGPAPVRLLYCMRRRDGMSLEAFRRYWRHDHAALAMAEPNKRKTSYRQLHADVDASRRLAAALGLPGDTDTYDGVAISEMETLQDLPLVTGRGDRMNFVDAASETGLFLDLVHVSEH